MQNDIATKCGGRGFFPTEESVYAISKIVTYLCVVSSNQWAQSLLFMHVIYGHRLVRLR